ncbi:MAG: T9SS type A sorting domain-containing protein [Bacteroidales bacterium]|nr:T9SS type A sorting domain-containing protein [Bacteroidales bacterium]
MKADCAGSGFLDTYLTLSVNNSNTNYYLIGGTTNFDGTNLGTIENFVLKGGDFNCWWEGGSNMSSGAQLCYQIKDVATSSYLGVHYMAWNYVGHSGNNWHANASVNVDLFVGLTAGKSYELQIWLQSWRDGCDYYFPGNGSNLKLIFTVAEDVTPPEQQIEGIEKAFVFNGLTAGENSTWYKTHCPDCAMMPDLHGATFWVEEDDMLNIGAEIVILPSGVSAGITARLGYVVDGGNAQFIPMSFVGMEEGSGNAKFQTLPEQIVDVSAGLVVGQHSIGFWFEAQQGEIIKYYNLSTEGGNFEGIIHVMEPYHQAIYPEVGIVLPENTIDFFVDDPIQVGVHISNATKLQLKDGTSPLKTVYLSLQDTTLLFSVNLNRGVHQLVAVATRDVANPEDATISMDDIIITVVGAAYTELSITNADENNHFIDKFGVQLVATLSDCDSAILKIDGVVIKKSLNGSSFGYFLDSASAIGFHTATLTGYGAKNSQHTSTLEYTPNKAMIESTFLIYPNPVETELNVQYAICNVQCVEIFDITGKLHSTLHIDYSTTKISVVDLKPGIYFIKIGDYIGKFVKK